MGKTNATATPTDERPQCCHCTEAACFCTVESHARTVGAAAVGNSVTLARRCAYDAAQAVLEALSEMDRIDELAKGIHPEDDAEGDVWREIVGMEEPYDVLASIVGYISQAFGSVFPTEPMLPAEVVMIRHEQLGGHRPNDNDLGRSWLVELQEIRYQLRTGRMKGCPVAVEQMARRIELDASVAAAAAGS